MNVAKCNVLGLSWEGLSETQLVAKSQDPQLPADAPFDPWNRGSDTSLINIVNASTSVKFVKAYEKRPDLFGLDERALLKKLREERCKPTPTDNRLRLAFWQQYELVMAGQQSAISLDKLAAGICAKEYLVQEYFKYPQKVAWMITPPVAYTILVEEGLQFGLEQLRDILETDHHKRDEDGNVTGYDTKLMEMKLKITAMLDQRSRGSVVQRIEQKTLNVSVTDKQITKLSELNSMEEIEKKLAELRKRDRHAQKALEVKVEGE